MTRLRCVKNLHSRSDKSVIAALCDIFTFPIQKKNLLLFLSQRTLAYRTNPVLLSFVIFRLWRREKHLVTNGVPEQCYENRIRSSKSLVLSIIASRIRNSEKAEAGRILVSLDTQNELNNAQRLRRKE